MRVLILAVLAVSFVSSPLFATGFDCAKAGNATEKAICTVPELSRLDEQLATVYQAAESCAAVQADFQRDQQRWLTQRNTCGSDHACIKAAYEARLQAFSGSDDPAAPPLTTLAEINNFSPSDYRIRADGERIIFSQYDKSGNNFEIVAYNLADQSTSILLPGRNGARFITQDDQYLVFSERKGYVNLVQVLERKSGKILGSIKLLQDISWAKKVGKHLIAVQGSRLGAWARTCPALVLEMPTLKLLKSVEITGGNDARFWNGKILSLGNDALVAYDLDLNEVFRIPMPPSKPDNLGRLCSPGPLVLYQNKVATSVDCAEIAVYDLPTQRLGYRIHNTGYPMAALDGLLFTAPTFDAVPQNSTHVYDLNTGRELAMLPINRLLKNNFN